MTKPSSGWLQAIGATTLSAALLAAIALHFVDFDDFVSALGGVSTSRLARAIAVAAATLPLAAVRWRLLLSGLGCHVSTGRCLFAVLATWPVSALTPSRGGDLLRASVIRDQVPLSTGIGSVLVEKLLDLQSALMLAALGAAATRRLGLAAALLGAIVSFWVGLALVPRLARRVSRLRFSVGLSARLEMISTGTRSLFRARTQLAGAAALSVAACGCSYWVISELVAAAGAEVPAADLLLCWPGAMLASAAPVAISGLGARDATLLGLLTLVSPEVDRAAVLTATLLFPVVTSWAFAVLGLPFTARAFARDPALWTWLRSPARSSKSGGND